MGHFARQPVDHSLHMNTRLLDLPKPTGACSVFSLQSLTPWPHLRAALSLLTLLVLSAAQTAWAQAAKAANPAPAPTAATALPAKSADTAAASAPTTQLTVMRVLHLDGADTFAPAATVQPGDVLRYAMTFNNTSAGSLRDVVASLPVPAGTQLLATGLLPAGAWASVDGKTFSPMPVKRKVQLATGAWADQPVPLAELRFVRWPARSLAAGERWQAALRVQVLATGGGVAALPGGPVLAAAAAAPVASLAASPAANPASTR
jgi:uncharacterized repeat protein (TIGR01451 family)